MDISIFRKVSRVKERDAQLSCYSEASEQLPVDVETVRRAVDGDKDAFEELFQCTYRRMFFVARHILSRDEDIYDALQTAYSKAYKYIGRVSLPEKFYPWLAKIVENCAKDVWRETHPNGELTSEIDEQPSPDIAEDADRRVLLGRVLKEMDPRRAEVLALYYYDGLKLAEISKMLDEPISTIHSRLKAAKRELIDLLAQRGIDRSFYSGGFFSAVAVALRSVLGTDILSAAVAQKMVDEVMSGKPGRLDMAAAKLVEKQRNKAILRIAGLLLAVVVAVALLTSAIFNGWFVGKPTPQDAFSPTIGATGQTTTYTASVGTTTVGTSGSQWTTTENSPVGGSVASTMGSAVTSTTSEDMADLPLGTASGTMVGGATQPAGTIPTPTVKQETTKGTTSASSIKPTSHNTTTASKQVTATTAKTTTTVATKTSAETTTTTGPSDNDYAEDFFTYIVSNGEATLTGTDNLLEGELIIPSTVGGYPVTSIGNGAFRNSSISSVTIPDSVTTIQDWAFSHCSSLALVTMGDGVETIGEFAFTDCGRLTSITFGKGVKTIGRKAFSSCGLRSVKVEGDVETIGAGAFSVCKSLTSVTVGDSVKTIVDGAFQECLSLTTVWLGDGVASVGVNAFNGCFELKTVYYAGDETEREAIAVGNWNDPLLSATWIYNAQE